jgi:sugar phosphate isomerase/epimerase
MQFAGIACVSKAVRPQLADAALMPLAPDTFPIRLGTVAWVGKGQTADDAVKRVYDLGLVACQIGFEHPSLETAGPLRKALDKYGIEGTAVSEHNPGPRVFDFYQGPTTVGIIPPATRRARIELLKLAAEVAAKAGIPAIHTHCGFIPEDPNDPLYPQAVAAVKEVAAHCQERRLNFLCETGQETPVTLLRLIEDVGLENVLVNLDVANLILYGKGNPVEAMDVLGHRVGGLHAKDGMLPTNAKDLGAEVPLGTGRVDFPGVFDRLKKVNYTGTMLIEREIQGPQRDKDILQSKVYLEHLIANTYSVG